MAKPYELFYWAEIPGRGEIVRLVLEEAGAPYRDVARLSEDEGGGYPAIRRILGDDLGQTPGFAPPLLRSGELVISQTTNICQFLARRHGLVPKDEAGRLHANQLALTLVDLMGEAHETHHPISVRRYYEEQEEAARQRAADFVSARMPKFLRYFEQVIERGDGEHLLGSEVTYVDLMAFQVLRGLAYAFPNAYRALRIPRLRKLATAIAKRPRIAAYLASPRHVDFNEHGIFRHYPELDAPAPPRARSSRARPATTS